jgi:undecaprenyl pyrophosphate synthase
MSDLTIVDNIYVDIVFSHLSRQEINQAVRQVAREVIADDR